MGDQVAHSDLEKANLLNSFFCSCFNTLHPPVFNQVLAPGIHPDEILCSEPEVFDLLVALDVSKASGPDGISARMLKYTAASIAPSLTKLFNVSLATGNLPSVWKRASIIPIPKSQHH